MPSDLPDHLARRAAVEDLDHTLFYEAGAGTGKTTMLVDRVVALVMSGRAHMDHIAAITFTEAAAAELRDRLAERFEQLAADEANVEARAAVAALDGASVTTLHGFARRILAEQPFAIGLPPLFEVTDRSSALVAFDDRWERFVSSLLGDAVHADLVTRALSCGVDVASLRSAALQCEANFDRLAPLAANGPPPGVDAAALSQFLRSALSLRHNCSEPDDLLLQFLDATVEPSLDSIDGAVGEIDLLQILVGLPTLSSKKGQKGNWIALADGRSSKETVVDALAAAESERLRIIDRTVQWTLAGLFAHIVTFTLDGADERRNAGRLNFLDLLVLARDLVSGHPEARRELHQRYRHILIDEFQDTDPIQAELAMYLATDEVAEGDQDWPSFPVPPGRLFFVGDPKQSIYRFRRADIDLFMSTRRHVVDTPHQLVTNFRSRPPIVSWLNAVFAGLFGDGVEGKQPAYHPLAPSEDRGQDNPRGLRPVIVLGREPLPGAIDNVRAQQGAEVVQAIATMQAEGWKVGPGGTPLSFSDVAVLVPTRTGLPILEAAFVAANVPYRLESSSLVYESHDVRQLLSVLRAIGDPTDALSLLAALRSPAFGCSDDDLFVHAANGGAWDPRQTHDSGTAVGQALRSMQRFAEGSRWQSVSALVCQVVSECRLMELALAEPRARESWRRIRFVQDQARLFDEVNGGDLRTFLRWVGHQQEEGANVTEAILPESDDDAVKITTVHAAKGLEYPVVFLLGLEKPPTTSHPALLFTPQGPEVRLNKSFVTPGYTAASQAENDMAAYEQQRLLYVAATRACDVLVIAAHRKVGSNASLASQLMAQCEGCPELWSDGGALCETGTGARRSESGGPTTGAEGPDSSSQREEFARRRDALLARESVPATIAATGVQRLALQRLGGEVRGEAPGGVVPDPDPDLDPDPEEAMERGEEAIAQRRGRAGTAIGRAVHAVLQLINLENGDGLDALCHAQAVAEGVGERSGEIRQLVRSALDSPLVQRAVGGGKYWREVYVGVPVGGRVLEGFIDLLFETPEGLVVVDYKTDRLDGDDAPSMVLGRYRWQGASYALAVASALGRPVAGCSFLILRAGGATEVSLPDLDSAMSEVEYVLGTPDT
jgi:ATP-dependent exoDNAse (exonuclease V) beta subunit